MKFWILPFKAVFVDKVLTKINDKFLYIYYRDPINDPYLTYKVIDTGKNCVAEIGFFVHDISPEKLYDKNRNWVLFSENNAIDLIKFVKKYLNEVELIVCQCSGGVSRSSATAAALDECINDKERSGVWNDGAFVPNKLIYGLIKKHWILI